MLKIGANVCPKGLLSHFRALFQPKPMTCFLYKDIYNNVMRKPRQTSMNTFGRGIWTMR